MNILEAMKSFVRNTKAKLNMVGILVDVALLGALLPVIRGFVVNVQANGSATEAVLYGLLTLVIGISFIYSLIKESGLQKMSI